MFPTASASSAYPAFYFEDLPTEDSASANQKKLEFLLYKVFVEEAHRRTITEESLACIEDRLRKIVHELPADELPTADKIETIITRILTSFRKAVGREQSIRDRNLASMQRYIEGYTYLLKQEEFTLTSFHQVLALHRAHILDVLSSDPTTSQEEIARSLVHEEETHMPEIIEEYYSLIGSPKAEREHIIALLSTAPHIRAPIEVNFYTRPGQALYLVGEEQGWDPSKAIRLDPIEDGKWSLTSNLPSEGSEYKFLIGPWTEKGSMVEAWTLQWENDGNRAGDTSSRPLYFS